MISIIHPETAMSDRLAQLEKNLTRLYALLGAAEDGAIGAISKIDKLKYEMEADDLKPQIRKVAQEYVQEIANQIKRQDLPEPIAETVVGELVYELEMMEPIAKTDEMRSMRLQILEELQKPGEPAAAKLKVAIPLVPGFVAIELEGDAESVVRRLFSPLKKLYEEIKGKK